MEQKEKIQKPVSLVIEDTRTEIAKVISESGLHISVIDMIVKELYIEIRSQAEKVLQAEMEEYQRRCEEIEE